MTDFNDYLDSMALVDGLAVRPSTPLAELQRSVTWHLKGEPYEVQLAALHACDQHEATTGLPGFAWFMEQGLGKTPTALNNFLDKLEKGEVEVMVVLAPPSFLKDWAIAFKDWVPPHRQIPIYRWPENPMDFTRSMGAGRPRERLGVMPPPFVFLVNWEMTRQDSGFKVLDLILRTYKCMLIEDETAYVKNSKTGVGKATIDLAKAAKFARALNGTPVPQDFTDVYGQYRSIRLWSGWLYTSFKKRFAVLGGYMGKKIVGVKPERQEELTKMISQHCFRAMKRDWAKSLPPKLYNTHHFEMTPEQRDIYYQMEQDFYVEFGSVEIEAEMVTTQRIKLQQISSGFMIDTASGTAHRIMPADKNPKLLAMLEDYRSSRAKFCITRLYQETTPLLMEAFDAEKIRVLVMKAGMSDDEMTDLKDEFNRNDAIDGLILPSKIGRMGHTLLGTERRRCAKMHMFENSYNRLDRAQIEDRIHRWGQDAEVCMYTDYAGTPVERDIAAALQAKADMEEVLVNIFRARPSQP